MFNGQLHERTRDQNHLLLIIFHYFIMYPDQTRWAVLLNYIDIIVL